jgi:hypothetical protein
MQIVVLLNNGSSDSVFVIAEMSANHQGSKSRALEIIHAAAESGADAIKYLLQLRGNKTAALLLGASGNLGRTGYCWVASHRNTWPIKVATRVLYFLNK